MKAFTWQFLGFLLLLATVEAGCPPSAAVNCRTHCKSEDCEKFNITINKKDECICKCPCKGSEKKIMGKS
ncbi:hypothetical protein TWF481_002268 [Arthrobotrys musiformis]|uniref:Uncharacterized protein n=1 Tax=Arthrobotrys musiformis TaxID=47236 RepID=A0AAV9VTS7_9PEZI